MEQIETQVSDLRYLTEAPVSLPADRLGGLGGIAFGAAAPHNQLPAVRAGTGAGAAAATATTATATALSGRPNANTATRPSTFSATPGDNSALHAATSQTTLDAAGRSTGGGANKRKSEDEASGTKQQRSKRNRVSRPGRYAVCRLITISHSHIRTASCQLPSCFVPHFSL